MGAGSVNLDEFRTYSSIQFAHLYCVALTA